MSLFSDLESRAKGELDALVETVKGDAANVDQHIRKAFHFGVLHSSLAKIEADLAARRQAIVDEYHKLFG